MQLCDYDADYITPPQLLCWVPCDLWSPTAASGHRRDRQCSWNKLDITYLQIEAKGLKRDTAAPS